jgi:hypothetical protein
MDQVGPLEQRLIAKQDRRVAFRRNLPSLENETVIGDVFHQP